MHSRPIALLALTALLTSSPAPARADTVVLKDGRVITGKVVERGDRVFIEMPLGGMSIERSEVVRIEGAEGVITPDEPETVEDVVILRDGRTLRGDVRISDDGSEVIVSMGERGEARHPRYSVAKIKRRDGTEEIAPAAEENAELRVTIKQRISELSDESRAVRDEARRELLALGPFAKSYLARLAAEHSSLIPIMEELELLEAYRAVLPSRVEESIPRLAERLVARGEEGVPERESALKAIVLEAPDDAGPVLLHAVATDESKRIKAYGISQLAALRCYVELAQVLKLTNGPLRLAAAFALGDSGIFVGIPILIEALKLTEPSAVDIRVAAITKLREYTGQHFGYRPRASASERKPAVEKWETWWAESGTDVVRDSLKQVAPDLPGGRVTEEETIEATQLWDQATRVMADALDTDEGVPSDRRARRQKLERALALLKQALDLDPGLSTARMTRAVLLYEEFERYEEAKRELGLIISRAKHDPGDPDAAKKFAHYHLGQVGLAEARWEKAAVCFTQALNYDQHYAKAHEGQGDAYLQQAFAAAGADSRGEKARREALESAQDAYVNALAAQTHHEENLHRLMRELVTDAPSDLEEGKVLQSVQRSTRSMDRYKASLYAKLGRVHAGLHNEARALEAYRQALRIDPDNEDYQRAVRLWASEEQE
jgi:tetratricopeptide (TPR) repeat protein